MTSSQVLADRYELRGLLGSGGMARVMEGYDRVLARRVAVKLLREDIGGGQALRERMLREARTAASFHHPNAVAVFDTGQEGRTPYIVMELIEGGTLADELAEHGALEARRAIAIAEQVLSALAAAHRRGLVHRDVKPANIMLPRETETDGYGGERGVTPVGVKLTDFGIAKGVEDVAGLTVDGQVLGTPKYLSPEQVAGKPATARSDVYAMGVVLYEMLAGEAPFTSDNPFAVAIAHQEDAPPPLGKRVRGLDRGLVAVVHRALEKDPERRFADADAMRSALRQTAAGIGATAAAATTVAMTGGAGRSRPAAATQVMEPSAPGSPRQGRRRRGGWLAVAAAIALIALAGLLVLQAGSDDTVEQDPVEEATTAPEGGTTPTFEPEPQPQPEGGPDSDPLEPDPQPEPEPEPTPEPTAEPEPGPPEEPPGEPTPGPQNDEELLGILQG